MITLSDILNVLTTPGVGLNHARVYFALLALADTDDVLCRAGNAEIADRAGVRRRDLRAILGTLAACDWIDLGPDGNTAAGPGRSIRMVHSDAVRAAR